MAVTNINCESKVIRANIILTIMYFKKKKVERQQISHSNWDISCRTHNDWFSMVKAFQSLILTSNVGDVKIKKRRYVGPWNANRKEDVAVNTSTRSCWWAVLSAHRTAPRIYRRIFFLRNHQKHTYTKKKYIDRMTTVDICK